MNKLRLLSAIFIMASCFYSCGGDDELVDQEKPIINLNATDAFPVACDILYFGETFTLKAVLSDNQELGSFSIDIHNNFDHHNHSTETTECSLSVKKSPVNPYVLIEDYEIPDGLGTYETNVEISIPASDGKGLYDEGDYHFSISLVDQVGWSSTYSVGVKMMHR